MIGPLRRTQSSPYDLAQQGGEGGAAALHRALERQIRLLQHEVGAIQQRVAVFEEINARWALRYTRRLAMGGSVGLGVWLFLARLFAFLQARRAQLLQAVIPKVSTSSSFLLILTR